MIDGRVHVLENGKKRSKFTMHYVIFDPKKKVVTRDEAKKLANAVMKTSKKKLEENYDIIYAQAYKDRMGRKRVTCFKICTKIFANCIFVIPKKWRKEAKKEISEFFIF